MAHKNKRSISGDTLTRLNKQQEALLTIGRVFSQRDGDPERILREMTETLSRTLDIERVGIWHHDHEHPALVCDDLYEATPHRHLRGMVLAANRYPVYFAAVAEEEIILAENTGTDARIKELAADYLEKYKIGALINVPFHAGNELAGVLSLEHVGGQRSFHVDEINTVKYLASMLGVKMEGRFRTQQTQKTEELPDDELALWQILFEQSMDGIVVLDMNASVYKSNKRYADMLGYSQAEMDKLHVWDWDTSYSNQEILELLRVVDTSGAHFETTQRRKDGTIIDVELSNNGAFYKGKKLIFCIVRDITERKEAEQKIRTLAITDGLTGIINRQEFSRILEKELVRATRYGTPLSLIMYDLDHFKEINDHFGHDVGDHVLRTVVGLVNDGLRSSDVQGRWGGEEFMVLLPQSGLAAAECVANKLCQTIAHHRFDTVESVTGSFGVVEFKPPESSSSLEKRVDNALYRAKANGRNRVEAAVGE